MKKKKISKSESRQLEHSLGAEVRRLKAEVDSAYRRYKREEDPITARPLMQNWLKLSAQLAVLAKAAPKADLDASQVLVRSDVEATWSRMLLEFRKSLETMGRRIATNKLFARIDPVDVEQLIRAEVDQSLDLLAGKG